jgi:uncharacterized protein (TIGR00369 family)
MATDPTDVAKVLNGSLAGFIRMLGLRFERATSSEVVATIAVTPDHLQVHGIVHGGVHASAIETACSVGASLSAMATGRTAVGLENHTSFVRALREGTLRISAKPLTRGKRTELWQAEVTDDSGLVARGTVRLLCVEQDAVLAGKQARWEVLGE